MIVIIVLHQVSFITNYIFYVLPRLCVFSVDTVPTDNSETNS